MPQRACRLVRGTMHLIHAIRHSRLGRRQSPAARRRARRHFPRLLRHLHARGAARQRGAGAGPGGPDRQRRHAAAERVWASALRVDDTAAPTSTCRPAASCSRTRRRARGRGRSAPSASGSAPGRAPTIVPQLVGADRAHRAHPPGAGRPRRRDRHARSGRPTIPPTPSSRRTRRRDARARVSLLVNRGEQATTYVMPDVIGMDGTRAAESAAQASGFRVTVVGSQTVSGRAARHRRPAAARPAGSR